MDYNNTLLCEFDYPLEVRNETIDTIIRRNIVASRGTTKHRNQRNVIYSYLIQNDLTWLLVRVRTRNHRCPTNKRKATCSCC